MNIARRASSLVLLVAAILADAQANGGLQDEKLTTLADQQEVAVTIYNDDLGLVKDARKVKLDRGANRLAWREVSAHMRPETALVRNLSDPDGFRLIEQNFDFDLLTPQKLLEKYVGKAVTVITTNPATGVERREAATLLASNGGVVLKFADRIETGLPGRLAFSGVPENLRDQPTLVISLISSRTGDQNLELSYLTGGLSWKADYVAELNGTDDRLDMNGWVTLTNQSGASYPNARLQLVAGDVNRVREELMSPRALPMMAKAAMAGAQEMTQENLFEYHLYTLQQPTTIAENQTKQVALMTAQSIPVRKEFLLQGANYYYSGQYAELGQKIKVGVFVEFDNKGEGLGIPLPKGIVRVYKKDAKGNAQFVGEDRIDHTPKNETVRLRLGDAFDITANRKQTDFRKVSGTSRYNYVYESAYQITIKNAKSEPITVKVAEPMPGDWQILSESLPHTKAASGMAVWQVPVAAEGSTVLTYRAQVRY
ncbi:MAG: DUF4139 domain-containing protein [Thiobacillaceae bacterium]